MLGKFYKAMSNSELYMYKSWGVQVSISWTIAKQQAGDALCEEVFNVAALSSLLTDNSIRQQLLGLYSGSKGSS